MGAEDKVRVSDIDRGQTTEYLQEAMAQGFISPDELSTRVDAALKARTRGELNQLVEDLPEGLSSGQVAPVGAPVHQPAEAVLTGRGGSVKRHGAWNVPAQLLLEGRGASYKLDFTQARIVSEVVYVDLNLRGCSVELRLSENASTSLNDVENVKSSIDDHRRDATAVGRPHFEINGYVKGSSVHIRGPKKKLFGR